MSLKVQARLDEETQAALDRVMQRTGWSASKVVREGLRLLLEQQKGSAASRMVGIGILDFGPGDIATNKKYLDGFGTNSGIDGSAKVRARRKVG